MYYIVAIVIACAVIVFCIISDINKNRKIRVQNTIRDSMIKDLYQQHQELVSYLGLEHYEEEKSGYRKIKKS